MTIKQQRKNPTAVLKSVTDHMNRNDQEMLDFRLFLFHSTEKVWLVGESPKRDEGMWIPRSQCEISEEPTGKESGRELWDFRIPEWLATMKGLI